MTPKQPFTLKARRVADLCDASRCLEQIDTIYRSDTTIGRLYKRDEVCLCTRHNHVFWVWHDAT